MTRQAVYRRIDRLGIKLGDRPTARGAGRAARESGSESEDEDGV